MVKEVPVDIENTCIGREMSCLIETIQGANSIQPYGDVSFRVIARMADVLMNRNNCHVYKMNSNSREIVDDLIRFQKRIYKHQKQQEKVHWIDIPERFLESFEINEFTHFAEQHQSFTDKNGIELLRKFLTTRNEVNEEYIKKISDPILSEQVIKDTTGQGGPSGALGAFGDGKRRGLKAEMDAIKAKYKNKFEKKYGGKLGNDKEDIYSVRTALLTKH